VIALSPDPMLHDGLIAAHALSGVIAFVLGAALALRRSRHPAQAMAYAIALTLMACS
jgi:VIT1/CCC1 family predicted Fe2+/Mn2+ transporter